MKTRIGLALVLAFILMLPAGTRTVFADSMSGITGGIGLEPPNWGSYFRVWIEFDAHQLDPTTYEAEGMVRARVYHETMGWKHLWYDVKCVSFGEVDGNPSATLVGEIVRREGWDDVPGAGDPGEYFKWQLVDGGTPGKEGDVWSIQYYDYANFVEYWPVFPGCEDFSADEPNYPDYGNLVIH